MSVVLETSHQDQLLYFISASSFTEYTDDFVSDSSKRLDKNKIPGIVQRSGHGYDSMFSGGLKSVKR